jgi:hypothetical protein
MICLSVYGNWLLALLEGFYGILKAVIRWMRSWCHFYLHLSWHFASLVLVLKALIGSGFNISLLSKTFEIVNAPKLKLLPKKGLPSSLLVLSMTHCPLLGAILRRKQGKEWRKISHISSIIIDGELITWVLCPGESLKCLFSLFHPYYVIN